MTKYVPPHLRNQVANEIKEKGATTLSETSNESENNHQNNNNHHSQNGNYNQNGHGGQRRQHRRNYGRGGKHNGRWSFTDDAQEPQGDMEQQHHNNHRQGNGYHDGGSQYSKSSYQGSENGSIDGDAPPPLEDDQYSNKSYNKRRNHNGYNNNHNGHGGRSNGRSNGRFSGFNDNDGYTREEPQEDDLFNNQMHTGINFDNYDKIPVSVEGDEIPQPLEMFDDIDLHPALAANIKRAGFVKPTPVQKYALPLGTQGRDMMACAQTGSGKTGGFLFPIIDTLLKAGVAKQKFNRNYNEPTAPQALILSPTRELTTQIYDEARKFLFRTGLRTEVVYGGAQIGQQIRKLRYGCNILVATPGRLVDLIKRGIVTLKNISYFVLDEADHMLDMGFETQIREIVECELMPFTEDRQTMLFSATFPKEIQLMAEQYLGKYVFLKVGRVGSATNDITQRVVYVEDDQKPRALLVVLNEHPEGLTLVFTRTKRDCDDVGHFLYQHNIPAQAIHGDRNQQSREYALNQFKKGAVRVLVATDVAARGLDISNVQHVVNFDMPDNIDAYVHRIGRTGRAGNKGLATGFYNTNNNNIAKQLVSKLCDSKQEVPAWLERYADAQSKAKNNKKYNSYHRRRYNNNNSNSGWGNNNSSGWGNSGNSGWGKSGW